MNRMEIPSKEAYVEIEHDATLGECPVWDERENLLYWVDILSGRLYRYDPGQKSNTGFSIGEHIGSFALRKEGGAVLAVKSGFAFYDFENEETTPVCEPETHQPGNRFNDGKCDPEGRFWAGTLSYEFQQGAGSLYCLNEDLSVEQKLRNLTIPNGMAWDTAKKVFYFIDSPDRKIYSFLFDMNTGELSNQTVVKKLADTEGIPDGMTIDTEGALWVALYNGSKVLRIDPGTGETLYEILLPVPKVTSCTFGGAGMDQLYITTAREKFSKEELEQYPLSGSLFKAGVPYRGIPATRFSG